MLSFCIATGDDPEADNNTDLDNKLCHPPKAPISRKKEISQQTMATDDLHCTDCGCAISSKVSSYSKQRYHIPLCMNCQKNHLVSA